MQFAQRFVQWQNYVHYMLLTIGFVLWIGYNPWYEHVAAQFAGGVGTRFFTAGIELFLITALGLFVVDSIVHAVFWFLPEPLQWRD